jgi:hypothetical protein
LLTRAKEALIAAIEAAQNSPMGQAVMTKVNEAQVQGTRIIKSVSIFFVFELTTA